MIIHHFPPFLIFPRCHEFFFLRQCKKMNRAEDSSKERQMAALVVPTLARQDEEEEEEASKRPGLELRASIGRATCDRASCYQVCSLRQD